MNIHQDLTQDLDGQSDEVKDFLCEVFGIK